jgi:hypothetical protein
LDRFVAAHRRIDFLSVVAHQHVAWFQMGQWRADELEMLGLSESHAAAI